ncbi:unnamed protein product [Gadus morhua 'NCC']
MINLSSMCVFVLLLSVATASSEDEFEPGCEDNGVSYDVFDTYTPADDTCNYCDCTIAGPLCSRKTCEDVLAGCNDSSVRGPCCAECGWVKGPN